jgi:hypothetical protein
MRGEERRVFTKEYWGADWRALLRFTADWCGKVRKSQGAGLKFFRESARMGSKRTFSVDSREWEVGAGFSFGAARMFATVFIASSYLAAAGRRGCKCTALHICT